MICDGSTINNPEFTDAVKEWLCKLADRYIIKGAALEDTTVIKSLINQHCGNIGNVQEIFLFLTQELSKGKNEQDATSKEKAKLLK